MSRINFVTVGGDRLKIKFQELDKSLKLEKCRLMLEHGRSALALVSKGRELRDQ